MSLHSVVSANRPHIAFFGRRNAGKSSVVNAVTNQNLSVVSDVKGTTTDPVKKAMELLPLGPVVIIDTPGFDDEGALGELRVEKTMEILRKTDVAVLVVDAVVGMTAAEKDLISRFKERNLPYVVAFNKDDLLVDPASCAAALSDDHAVLVSAKTRDGIDVLKKRLAHIVKSAGEEKKIVCDLLEEGSLAVLVIPVDESAPKGRLILPQQLVIRELLDHHCTVVCCQDTELKATLDRLSENPAIVITDSQAFERVAAVTPDDVPLTSFSILFARYKGNLDLLVKGAAALSRIEDGDRILISEGCTHHRQCNDIGAVKLPKWIEAFTGKKPTYLFTSGNGFESDLKNVKLIVHCGGCMLNEKEIQYRLKAAEEAGVPIVNYGTAIAHMHGILSRALAPFDTLDDKKSF